MLSFVLTFVGLCILRLVAEQATKKVMGVAPSKLEEDDRSLIKALDILTLLKVDLDEAQRDNPRQALSDYLIESPCDTLGEYMLSLVDTLYKQEQLERPPFKSEQVEAFSIGEYQFVLLLGDITKVHTDGIVNAANYGLTGCYKPGHACVDNAVHRAAGPRLRVACKNQVARNPKAQALLTPGFWLPSKWVIHVVGPNLPAFSCVPTSHHVGQLKECYTYAMSVASSTNMHSLAFCAISTGLYNFPAEQAAKIAVASCTEFVRKTKECSLRQIVFVVNNPTNKEAYLKAFQDFLGGYA